jgi:hypothetical protein
MKLLELDQIVDKCWRLLLRYREKEIEKEIDSEIDHGIKNGYYEDTSVESLNKEREKIRKRQEDSYKFQQRKSLTLTNTDGTKIKATDFSNIIQHPDVEGRVANGFSFSITCADIECQLELDSSYRSGMILNVSPGTIEESRMLFSAIKGWMNSIKAPFWQRLARGALYGCWWAVFVLILWISVAVFTNTVAPEWEQIKHAHELLKNGIDNSEINDALGTLLAIESKYEKPNNYITWSFPVWNICLLIVGFFLCLGLSIIPKVVIGIGKGEHSIILWRRWLHFISYTIPIVVLSSFVWPLVVNWIKSLFS